MRVFVTGSTGFVGTAVVTELISHGHKVLGLTRSNKGAQALADQGAEALHGTIEDLEILRKGAAACDAVAHLAFVHDFSNMEACCAIDRAAITAMGDALVATSGSRALVITSGVALLPGDKVGKEDDEPAKDHFLASLRGPSETLCLEYAKQGLRASVVRLAPATHGPGLSGFAGILVPTAMEKGFSAYIGDGQNTWSSGHRDDAAKLFRLAIEKAEPGSVFHANDEEAVPVKDVAIAIAKHLNIPVRSIAPEQADEHFGMFAFVAQVNNAASSAKTRERLGWQPTGPKLLEDVPVIVDFIKSQGSH